MEQRQVKNPFPGLRPFATDEYRLFFGREGQSDELLARLQRSRFLAVVGTSGSGKSSLIRAGLLPALRGGMMAGAGSGWRIAVMRPGGDPIGNLAHELARKEVLAEAGGGLSAGEAEAVIEATLRGGSLGLVDAAYQGRLAEHEKLLVVVDQFEELFRFRMAQEKIGTGDEASAFVKLLIEAAHQRELSIYVVLTMRSDFLGDCAQFQGLPEAINDGQYLIPRMTRDERRVAVTGPVGVTRGKISEPLVNRLLNDVGDNPDQLPILQHALMRTWDHWSTHRRNGEPIGLEHYEAVGTMSDALSRHADEAWAELDQRGQAVAELLFKTLTERGADNREIRRPTSLQDICAITNTTAAEVCAVIDVFRGAGRSFLMPPAGVELKPETVVDISHESLIRNWDRLRAWVEDEAQSARIYRRLAEAATDYYQKAGGLLDDVTLQYVMKWHEQEKPQWAWGVRYHPDFNTAMSYLELSTLARDARIEAEQERERRELETTRAFAEKQARSAQRLRRFAWALVLISLLALTAAGASVYAFATAKRSELQAKRSETNAVELQKKAEGLAQALQKSSNELAENYKTLETGKARAEELATRLGKEKKRADDALIAEKAAVEKQKLTLIAQERATATAKENEALAKAAKERGELMRNGLETSRRGDSEHAYSNFTNLITQLQAAIKSAPRRKTRPENAASVEDLNFDLGWALSNIGAEQRRLENYDKAIANYEQARTILTKVLHVDEATLKVDDKALPVSQPAASPSPDDGQLARNADPTQIWTLFDTYDGLAHAYQEKATEVTRKIRTKEEEQEQFRNAEKLFKMALAYQQKYKSDESTEAANSHQNLARLYTDMGRFDDAEKNYRRVVEINKKVEANASHDATISALKQLAEFYRDQGRYEDAARAYTDLIEVEEQSDAEKYGRDIVDAYSDLGQVYSSLKRDGEAAGVFQLADKLQKTRLKQRQSMAQGGPDLTLGLDDDYDALGDAYVEAGRFRLAQEAFENSLHLRQLNQGQDKTWQSYERLANLYLNHLKDGNKAADYFKAVVNLRKEAPDKHYTDALRELGSLYAGELDQPAEAEQLFKNALAVFGANRTFTTFFHIAWWDGEDATYAALIALYRRQNNGNAVEQAYERRLDALARNYGVLMTPASNPDVESFGKEYVKGIGEVAGFFQEQKKIARAETLYKLAFDGAETITLALHDSAPGLAAYAAVLESYRSLLVDLKKPGEVAPVEEVIKEVRKTEAEAKLNASGQPIQRHEAPRQTPPTPKP